MEEAHRCREVVDVPEWMGDVILVCPGELLVGCFGCAFDACVECVDVSVRGGWVFTPHGPENSLEFLCFGDPGGEAVDAFGVHLVG